MLKKISLLVLCIAINLETHGMLRKTIATCMSRQEILDSKFKFKLVLHNLVSAGFQFDQFNYSATLSQTRLDWHPFAADRHVDSIIKISLEEQISDTKNSNSRSCPAEKDYCYKVSITTQHFVDTEDDPKRPSNYEMVKTETQTYNATNEDQLLEILKKFTNQGSEKE